MSNDKEKARAFVTRLLANPGLKALNPLQKEENILVFMEMNASQLFPTLSSPAFFPGRRWPEILSILQTTLSEMAGAQMGEGLKRLLYEKLDYGFFSFFFKNKSIKQDLMVDSLYNFILKTFATVDGRRDISGSYNAVLYKVPDRYLAAVFENQSYTHFELVKVQHLRLSKEEIVSFINVSLLLRSTVHIFSEGMHDRSSGLIHKQYADKVEKKLLKELPALPGALIASAVQSFISFEQFDLLPATGRLTSIFNAMAASLRPNMKVDRGASSPEKSWLSVARHNYRYYGWDIKILEELYRHSVINNW